jgi:hypothetical protein
MSQASARLAPAPAAAHSADQGIKALVQRLAEIGAAFAQRHRAFGQICAGAESLASACQHHNPAVVIGRRALDCELKRLRQWNVQRVHALGPVQRQGQDPRFKRFQQYGLI